MARPPLPFGRGPPEFISVNLQSEVASDQWRVNPRTGNEGGQAKIWGDSNRQPFVDPPFTSRSRLFCCPVAESNPDHLPRCFVNPGRHLMNVAARNFCENADDPHFTAPKCEVSHIVEVTTRILQNPSAATHNSPPRQHQWNTSVSDTSDNLRDHQTPPSSLDYDDKRGEMLIDEEEHAYVDIPYSTHQSMSTRYFISQTSSSAWQMPPHSRHFRDSHRDAAPGRASAERYIEIPPFRTTPYTSDSSSSGPGSRAWSPSLSMLMWCNKHGNFYELHVLS